MKALVSLVITEPISRAILEKGIRQTVHDMPEEDRKPALKFYSNYMGDCDKSVVYALAARYLAKEALRLSHKH
jgi:hypothetical protein